jgi:hypothetical protein
MMECAHRRDGICRPVMRARESIACRFNVGYCIAVAERKSPCQLRVRKIRYLCVLKCVT